MTQACMHALILLTWDSMGCFSFLASFQPRMRNPDVARLGDVFMFTFEFTPR